MRRTFRLTFDKIPDSTEVWARFPNSGMPACVELASIPRTELGVTPEKAGVTPWKFRRYRVEIAALPRGNFGVTPWSNSSTSGARSGPTCGGTLVVCWI